MRVVLDSSVLIAAYISRAGVCADLLEDVLMEHEWIISDFIAGEVRRKLKEKFRFPDAAIAEILDSIVTSAEVVVPADLPPDSCRDPNDLPVLGTAIAGNAAVLITVDKDLLDLKSLRHVTIIRPSEFFGWPKDLRD